MAARLSVSASLSIYPITYRPMLLSIKGCIPTQRKSSEHLFQYLPGAGITVSLISLHIAKRGRWEGAGGVRGGGGGVRGRRRERGRRGRRREGEYREGGFTVITAPLASASILLAPLEASPSAHMGS